MTLLLFPGRIPYYEKDLFNVFDVFIVFVSLLDLIPGINAGQSQGSAQ